MDISDQSPLPPEKSKDPNPEEPSQDKCEHEYPLVKEEGRYNIITGLRPTKWLCQLCEEILETTYCDKDGRPLLLD